MNLTAEKLYQLLPAFYRLRDSEQGEPLKALIAVIAEQAGVVEADITKLYENWFVETCDEWVVPYIGDLLGIRSLHLNEDTAVFSRRAYVANTMGYRRRKGTAPVLEQLAFDATGWRARVVEFFELLGTTQNINHVRLHNNRTPDIRRTNELEMLNTAFDEIGHTVDVRRIAIGRGRHNIHNIGLFLWRLQSYPMTRTTARKINSGYTFSPLGNDMSLFNRPKTEDQITHLAEEINVPGLLRRRPLYDELEARRQAIVDGKTPEYLYFDNRVDSEVNPVLEVFINESTTPVPSEEILICNLQDWHIPAENKKYNHISIDGTVTQVGLSIQVAVDPYLGRLTFPSSITVNQVQVSYSYGFSADVGGGPYNRRTSVAEAIKDKVDWQVGVSKEVTPDSVEIFAKLAEAVDEWNKQPAGIVGVITIMDNHSYEENLAGSDMIKIPEGSRLMIVAADWLEENVPGGLPGQKQRSIGRLTPVDSRPHLLGNMEVKGTAVSSSLNGGELILNGLLVEGQLSVLAGNLAGLRVSHSTLVPGQGGLEVKSKNDHLVINMVRSICGPVKSNQAISKLFVDESIVDHGSGDAIKADKTAVELQKSSIFGQVKALKIEAGNCIFTKSVLAKRRQEGCVRFCSIPPNSKTPRRFRCQPDLALKESKPSEHVKIQVRLVPSFTSGNYDHHGYAQLSLTCAEEIQTGAEDGSEMGVFCILKQPQRIANLATGIDEYLRLGLEAGVFFVT
jgi:hypothetical protein